MKLAAEPGGNTPRATCERTDAVELGRACRCTARYETPRKRKIGSANARPDSRTPRRLTSTIRSRQPSESATLCPASDGANEVIAKIPAEIETATVRT